MIFILNIKRISLNLIIHINYNINNNLELYIKKFFKANIYYKRFYRTISIYKVISK